MQAIYALSGIIIGAVLSWVGVALNERSKRRHEGWVLVRGEKLQAYTAFTAEAKAFMAQLYSVAGQLGIDDQTETKTLEEALPELDKIYRARDKAFEQILMVGSDALVECARTWVKKIYAMRQYLDTPTPARSEWEALVHDANEARNAFYKQARAELAIA